MNDYLRHLKEFEQLDSEKKNKVRTFLTKKTSSLDWYDIVYTRELGDGPYGNGRDDTYRDADPATKSERVGYAFENLRNSITPEAKIKISEFNDDQFKDFLTTLTQHQHIESVKTTHELAKIVHEVLGLADELLIDVKDEELIQYSFNHSQKCDAKEYPIYFSGDSYDPGSHVDDLPKPYPEITIGEALASSNERYQS